MGNKQPDIPYPWEWYSDKVQWMAMNGPQFDWSVWGSPDEEFANLDDGLWENDRRGA
jgi:hypothetical protein